jgi:hypothetical protein
MLAFILEMYEYIYIYMYMAAHRPWSVQSLYMLDEKYS